jgi:hypothetical protein
LHSERGDKWTGQNPMRGAILAYYLKEAPKSDITIEILDAQNNIVKTLSSKPKAAIGLADEIEDEEEGLKKAALPKAAGVNLAAWDLTYDGAELISGAKIDLGNAFNGPAAPPGDYTARLTVDGKQYTSKVKLLPDPRVQVSASDLKLQQTFAISVRDEISRMTRIVNQLRSIRNQLVSRNELLKGDAKAAQLVKDSEAMIKKLDELEAKIHNPKAEVVYDILAMKGGSKLYSRMSALYDTSTDTDGAPTQGMRELFASQKAELDQYDTEMRRLLSDVSVLNEAAKRGDYPHVIVK